MNTPPSKSPKSKIHKAPLTVYADQLVQLGIGAHVSRLTFANEETDQKGPDTVLTLIISTPGFIKMLKNANDLLAEPVVLKFMKDDLKEHVAVVDRLPERKPD